MNKLFKVASLLPFFVAPLFAHVNVASYKSYVDSLLPGSRFGGERIGVLDVCRIGASSVQQLELAAAVEIVLFDADAFPGECFRERGIGALREGGVGEAGDAADFLWLLHIVWLYYI